MRVEAVNGVSLVLWRRWRKRGDAVAFGRLVREHIAFAFDFARRVTGHAADAEDVAQQALLELAEADEAVVPRVGIRAFLGRRIVLGARTLHRAALTRGRLEAKAAKAKTADPVCSTGATAGRASAADEVQHVLPLLDTEQRNAVVLRFLHGLSYAEVAHALGVREEAARMRVHRALKRLRRELDANDKTSFRPADRIADRPAGAGADGDARNAVDRDAESRSAESRNAESRNAESMDVERDDKHGKALLAPLLLFAPPHGLASSVTRTAAAGWSAAATGAVVMGLTSRHVVVVLALLATLVGGVAVWRSGRRDHRATNARHDPVRDAPPSPNPGARQATGAAEPGGIAVRPPPRKKMGEQADADTPRTEPVSELAPALVGTLRDASGAPMVNVQVAANAGPGVRTDGHGVFRLEPPAGDVTLYFVGEHALRVELARTVFDPAKPSLADLRLVPGHTLHGRVTVGGEALQGDVLIVAARRGGHEESRQGAFTTVRADGGKFRIPHLLPGTYSLMASPFRPGLREKKIEVELTNGDAFVELKLARTEALRVVVTGVPASLEGVGATVSLHRVSLHGVSRSGDESYTGIGFDLRNGAEVEMTWPKPGRYRLELALEYIGGTAVAQREIDIATEPGSPITLALPAGGALRGTFTGSAGPLARRSVRVGDARGETDASGFVTWPYLKPGTHEVRVKSGTGWLRAGSATVTEGSVNEFRVRKPGTAMLFGRVKVGGRVGDVTVTVWRAGTSDVLARLDVKADGSFLVDLLELGDYVVQADAGSARSRPVTVSLTSDVPANDSAGNRDVPHEDRANGARGNAGTLTLARPPRVPFAVEAASGVALPGRIDIDGPGVADAARLDRKGRGVFTETLPGTYRVTVTAPGFEPLETEIKIPGPLRFVLKAR